MLLDYCIGKSESSIEEFYLLPVGDKLIQYDTLAVNTIVKNKDGEVSSCDILYTDDLEKYNEEYLKYTREVAQTCKDRDLTDSMVIGTSAIIDTELDGAIGMNRGIFNNPLIIWRKYMIIESERIILRTWKNEDKEDLVEGLNNINVSKWMAGGGIWLNEKYQKNGYGTEAFYTKIKFAFEQLGLRRMENGYFPSKHGSERMQKKLGYKDEGIRRKKFLCLVTNEYVDECITGLLREEFVCNQRR